MHLKVLLLLLVSCSLFAAPLAVVNPGFELFSGEMDGCNASGCWNLTLAGGGWTVTDGTVVLGPLDGQAGEFSPLEPSGLNPYEGSLIAYSNGGTLVQDLGVALQPNTSYRLQVAVGRRAESGFWDANYLIALYAGSSELASTGGVVTNLVNGWSLLNVVYNTGASPAAGNLGIRLSADKPQAVFDAVSVNATAIVPEPGTFVLTGLAVIGLGFLGRIRRKR